MTKWRMQSEEIKIRDNVWSAKVLYLTNDPFNKPQLIINNRKFSASDEKEGVLVKSKWSNIELDDFIKIPTL